jgi:hypothetical protein
VAEPRRRSWTGGVAMWVVALAMAPGGAACLRSWRWVTRLKYAPER